MKTIRWIVSLVDVKARALVAILLIGIFGLITTVIYLQKGAEKDRNAYIEKLAIKDKIIEGLYVKLETIQVENKKEIMLIKDKANEEVKTQLLKSEEKVDRMESIIMNTVRAAKNVKKTERSQNRIIKQLKINNNE